MKKFMKFCGCTALILLIIGLILGGIGYLYAGSDSMNKLVNKLTDGKMIFDMSEGQIYFDKFEDFLDKNAIINIENSSMFNKDYTIWKDNVEKTKIADNTIKALEIEMGGSDFHVVTSEDDNIYMEYTGTGKSQAYVENGKLHLKVMNDTEFHMNGISNSLTFFMPEGMQLEEISIELGAGQMNLNGLQAKELKADIGAGQILADGLQSQKLTVSLGAGEIVLKEAKLAQVNIEVGAGNCEIQGSIEGDVEVECAMGNVSFELTGSKSEFNYEIQCVGGNITIGEDEYSGLSQEQSIANFASKTMDLECAMGNLEVKFK